MSPKKSNRQKDRLSTDRSRKDEEEGEEEVEKEDEEKKEEKEGEEEEEELMHDDFPGPESNPFCRRQLHDGCQKPPMKMLTLSFLLE